MVSRKKAVTGRFLIMLGIALAMGAALLGYVFSPVALADDGDTVVAEDQPVAPADEEDIVAEDQPVAPADEGDVVVAEDQARVNSDKVVRTIMIYLDGAASEENTPVLTAMLKEYMTSKFDRSQIRIIVMTGGSHKWHLEARYLHNKVGNADPLIEISSEYNQVWEVYPATNSDEGYLQLLDGDGVSGDGANAKKSTEELMYLPDTLKKFINFARETAPADKYDLILNDHGSGPEKGYGYDDHGDSNETLSVLELRQAISGSDVCANGGRFDFIDFDCCVMGNFETALALSDYTDYFLGSADVDPHATVDYTEVFNYLATNPNMSAWELGCKLVDLFVVYYDANPGKISVGPSDIFCVVNTQELKNSGIVNKLLAIARQMRAEATAGNFYDEIRVPKDAYHFAYVNLQDFATVMEQLGIGVYESDWQEPGFLNAYTQTALQIQSILHDENIVYSRHSQRSNEAHAFFGRNDNGDLVLRDKKSPTSGLSIFAFANPSNGDVSGEVASYIQAMKELSEVYAVGSPERELLETYVQAVLDYELICNAGVAVSTLVENGCAPDEIDYDKVLAYLQSQEDEHIKKGWEYISKAFEASDRNVRAWLSGIIDIQRKEVINRDKVSFKTESRDGTEYYRIDVTDTPKRVIDVPVLTVIASKEDELFEKPTRTFYGTRTLDDAEGESSGDYMSATDSSYLIPVFDGQWYAVQDAAGTVHLASDASENSVYAKFISADNELMGIGELIFDADGYASSIYIYGNTIPIALDTFEKEVTVALFNDPSSGSETPIDTFVLQGRNAKLVKDSWQNLGIKDVEFKLAILDMYDVQHEVSMTERTGVIVPTGSGHVQRIGDKAATRKGDGIVIGTTGKSKRLEAISVSLPEGTDGGIEYRAHLQRKGWSGWVANGRECGTRGESRRLEAVQMRLTGKLADTHSVWYRVHSQKFGWLGWASDGQAAGTAGQAKRAEAVEIQVLPKGQTPQDYTEGQASYMGAAVANVHLQGIGWTGNKSALKFGTTGQSRRLEALSLSMSKQPEAGGIEYEVHLQRKGWVSPKADGAKAGTTGQSRRLEAVKISLTGDLQKDFSVWYRVHSQTFGWLGWTCDGEPAGTTGLAKSAEAIEVQVLPKGQVPNGYNPSKPASRTA